MRLITRSLWLTAPALLGLSACAHNYFYNPEVSGAGATHGRGGIIYAIPPQKPQVKMKLVSLGVNSDKMIHVRMYFVRTADVAKATEYMIPAEQTVSLGDGTFSGHAVKVHAPASDQKTIQLSTARKQAVEMLFALPPGSKGISEVPYFNLHWKLHYGDNQSEEQTARFDRQDSANRQAAEMYPEDNDYPFDEAPFFTPNSQWIPGGWGWW